jgi:NADH-quinone oxidoreductase subunit L
MFLACGVGAFTAGIFHLMTHAFFKALLFLGAGSVIHAMSDEQDMRYMGGLKKYLPITFSTMFVATLAITGIPLFSGFFSKDEILWKAFSSEINGGWYFWVIGFVAAGLTAFYMFRLIFLTFYGSERMDAKTKSNIHESPRTMTTPLIVLAGLALVGGYIGMPHLFGVTNWFEEWLHPVLSAPANSQVGFALASGGNSATTEWILMGASVALVLMSIYLAYYFYRRNISAATNLAGKLSGIKNTLENKYYVDEFYGAVVIRPVLYFSLFLWKIVDVIIIDGALNGLASLWRDVSDALKFSQSGQLRGYATTFSVGVVLLIAWFVFG